MDVAYLRLSNWTCLHIAHLAHAAEECIICRGE